VQWTPDDVTFPSSKKLLNREPFFIKANMSEKKQQNQAMCLNKKKNMYI